MNTPDECSSRMNTNGLRITWQGREKQISNFYLSFDFKFMNLLSAPLRARSSCFVWKMKRRLALGLSFCSNYQKCRLKQEVRRVSSPFLFMKLISKLHESPSFCYISLQFKCKRSDEKAANPSLFAPYICMEIFHSVTHAANVMFRILIYELLYYF